MPLLFLLLSLLPFSSAFAADVKNPIRLRDANFYSILRGGSEVDCRYISGGRDEFGLFLSPRADGRVRVSFLSNNVREGDKTSFDAAVVSEDLGGTYLKYFQRQGDFGTHIEIVIESKVSPALRYRIPGRIMVTTVTYSRDANGVEKEELIPDGMHRMACKLPLVKR